MLQKAAKAAPGEKRIVLRFRGANLSALENKLRRMEAKGGKGDAATEIEQLKEKVSKARMAYFKTFLEVEPTRQDIRFDLGLLYFEKNQVDEAISCFQQVKKDPKKSRDASFWLGRAFLEKGKYNLAANQLESALGAEAVLDVRGKETLYFLGQARKAGGDMAEARKHFERIYEEDINFRDVADILDQLS
jgi:tetratricopeptide (TPR) repeat protein